MNKEAQLETIDVNHVAGGHHHPYWGGGWGGGYYGARFAYGPPVAYAAAPVAYAAAPAPVAYAAAAPTVVVYR